MKRLPKGAAARLGGGGVLVAGVLSFLGLQACQAPPQGRLAAGARAVAVSGDRAGYRRDDRRQPGLRIRSVEMSGGIGAEEAPLALLAGADWSVDARDLGDPHESSRVSLSGTGGWRLWAERQRDLYSTDQDDALTSMDVTRVSHAAGLELTPAGGAGEGHREGGLEVGVHWRRTARDAIRVGGWRLMFTPLEPLLGRESLQEDEFGLAAGWRGTDWHVHGILSWRSGRELRSDALQVPSPYLPSSPALAGAPPPTGIDPGLFPTDQTESAGASATVRSPSIHLDGALELLDGALELYGSVESHGSERRGSLRQQAIGPTQDPGVVLDFRALGGSAGNHHAVAGRAGLLWRVLPILDLSLEAGREEEKGEAESRILERFITPGVGEYRQVDDLTHAELATLDFLALESVLAPADFLDLRLRGESGRDHYLVRKTAFGNVVWRTDTTYPHRLYEAELDLKPGEDFRIETLARYGRTTALTIFAWEGPRFERRLRQRGRWQVDGGLAVSLEWEVEDAADRINNTQLRRLSRGASVEFLPGGPWQAILSAGSERWDWATVSLVPIDFRMTPVRYTYDDDLDTAVAVLRREGEAVELALQGSVVRARGDSGVRAVDLRARAGWTPGAEPDLRPFVETSWSSFRTALEPGDGYRALVVFLGIELVF